MLLNAMTIILSAVISVSTVEFDDEFIKEEDAYVKQFGNKANNTHEWTRMKEYLEAKDQLPAKKLCAAAHKKMFGKCLVIIETVAYKNGTLSFNSPKYRPMRVVYVEYDLQTKHIPDEFKEYSIMQGNQSWYLTQGLNKVCVHYLDLIESNSSTPHFHLNRHVCGLKPKYN